MRCVSSLAAIFLETRKASFNGVRVYFSFNRTSEEYYAQHRCTFRVTSLCASTYIALYHFTSLNSPFSNIDRIHGQLENIVYSPGTVKGSGKDRHRFSKTTVLRFARSNIESHKDDQSGRKED